MEGLEQSSSADEARLHALARCGIIDTPPEAPFDRLVELAAHGTRAPAALINFVERDRVWTKARFGSPLTALARSQAACAQTIASRGPNLVVDSAEGRALQGYAIDGGRPARAYLGVPLVTTDGLPLGALCVLDVVPRAFDDGQVRTLELVAEQIAELLEERRAAREGLERLDEAVITYDAQGQILAANHAAALLFRQAAPLLGRTLGELVPAAVALAVESARPVRTLVDFRHAGRRMQAFVHPLGRARQLFIRDVTDERAFDETLRRTHGVLEAVIEGSRDAIFAKDLQGRYSLINEVGSRYLGRPRAEVLGRTDHEVFPPERAHAVVSQDLEVMGAGHTLTFESSGAGEAGRTWLISKGLLREHNGQIFGLFGIARDITARKRAEEALALSEERLRLAMEAGHLAAWDWSVGLREVHASGAVAELLGLPPDVELSAARAEEAVIPEDRPIIHSALRDSIRNGAEVQVDFRVRRGAELRWLHARGRPVRDAAGQIVRIVGVMSDVTEVKRREAEAAALARFQERLLGIVSHDLRSPLSAIRVWASAGLGIEDMPARAQKASERIVHSVTRMDRMIADLLDFTRARLGGGIPVMVGPANLHEICTQVVEEVSAASPGRLRFEAQGDGAGAWDANRLAQLVSNLVSNALQYSPADSVVVVRCTGTEEHVELEVHNAGPAIAPELLAVIFEPFRRGSRAGRSSNLGLGLYISRETVAAHGGTIEVESAEGRGTTFRVHLPRERAR